MKRVNNNSGFALIETLVVATFVLTIFVMLIANYYPMMGRLQRYSNYDETESIYTAYHTVALIQENSQLLDNPLENTSGNCDKKVSNKCILKTYDTNTICNEFIDPIKQQKCQKFIELANINKIYITNYSIESLKENINNISNLSRSFELYVKYMPSHKNTSSTIDDGESKTREERLDRIIIQREIKDEKTGKSIYKYANYEIKNKGV